MAKRKFDLSGVTEGFGEIGDRVGAQTGPGDGNTGRKMVPFEKIVPNEMNQVFSKDAVEEIRLSIEENGLFHDLAVVYDRENDRYRLISGEQRYRAIESMDENVRLRIFPLGIPVNVLTFDAQLDEKIAIYEANIIQRKYEPDEKHTLVMELLTLYEEKEKQGRITGARKLLAEKLNMQYRMIARYAAANKVIPELKEALSQGKINLQEAEKLAALSEEAQRQMAQAIMSAGKMDRESLEAAKRFEKDNKELRSQVASAEKERKEQEETISQLQEQIRILESQPAAESPQSKDDIITTLNEKLAAAEKEKKKVQTSLDSLRLEMQERQEKGITATKEDLKKAKEAAKAENLYESFFAMAKDIEKLREVVWQDEELHAKYLHTLETLSRALTK